MSRMRDGKEALEGRGAWMRRGDWEDASALADSVQRGSSARSVPLARPEPEGLGRSRSRGWPVSPGQLAPPPPPAVPLPCSRHVEKLRCWPALRPVAQGLDGSLSDSSLLPLYPHLFGLACCSGSRTPECCPAQQCRRSGRRGGEGGAVLPGQRLCGCFRERRGALMPRLSLPHGLGHSAQRVAEKANADGQHRQEATQGE